MTLRRSVGGGSLARRLQYLAVPVASSTARCNTSSGSSRANATAFGTGFVNMKTAPLSGAQIRAARALLRWSAVDLAREASLGVNTIKRAEVADLGTSLTAANELAIRRALEAAGVEFIDENGGGPGLRLRKRQQKKG
jgi:hypothetical protein